MGSSIRVPNGILSLVETDFNCPKCECLHLEEDYSKQMEKSNTGVVYKICKGCKSKIGIAIDMRGDVKVWLKTYEKKEIHD